MMVRENMANTPLEYTHCFLSADGVSYQNAARTVVKGYGNYRQHTRKQQERPTELCANAMCLVWGLFTYPSRVLVTFN